MNALRPLLAVLLTGASATAIMPSPAAAQQSAAHSFAIEAQPLEAALIAFMRQSGVQVGYEPADVRGRRSNAVRGMMGTSTALQQLLASTGLTWQSTGAGSVRLQRLPQQGGSGMQLGPVRVQGAGGAGGAGLPPQTATGPVPGYRATVTATATRTDTPLRDIPQSIQVVPRAVIEDQAATRLTDVVLNVSGVQLNGTAGNRAETYSIRGFTVPRYAINGFPLTSTMDRPEGFLDLANVERVEVLKGPASVLVGLAEPGGIINIVTRAPTQTFTADAAVQGGSFEFGRAEASLSGPLAGNGAVSARVTGAYQSDGNFRRVARDSDRGFAGGALRWQPDALTQVDLTADYVDQKQAFDRGLIATEGGTYVRDARLYLGESWSTTETQKLVLGLAARRQVSPWLQLRLTGRYTDATITDDNGVDLQGVSEDGTVRRRVTDRTEDATDFSARFEGLADAYTGALEHQILLGAEYNRGDFAFNSARSNIGSLNMFAPVYGATPLPVTRRNAGYDYDARNWALFAQDQIALGAQWKLLAGLRYDHAESFEDDWFNETETRTDDDALTWRAGLVYQPTGTVSLYGSYTQSFVPQQGQLRDGSALNPEKGEQFEAGVKLDLMDRLSLTGAVFQITKRDVATDDPQDSDFTILTGEQRVRGAELDLTAEILPGWRIIGNVAYLDATVTEDNVIAIGNRLTGVPEWSGRLWTSYTIGAHDPAGRLQPGSITLAGGIRAVGDRAVNLDNWFDIAGYHTFDASVRYQLNRVLELSVNAENLADRFYIEGVQAENNLYPGTPRRILGTLRVRL